MDPAGLDHPINAAFCRYFWGRRWFKHEERWCLSAYEFARGEAEGGM